MGVVDLFYFVNFFWCPFKKQSNGTLAQKIKKSPKMDPPDPPKPILWSGGLNYNLPRPKKP